MFLADVKGNSDPGNVPLSEQEEHRLAWLGTELQPLNRELARENKVSELTHDGATGALVSYVYPGSPAAGAGVEPGWILLRLLIEDQPRPLEIQADETSTIVFPWQQLDRIPEELFDRAPTPWPLAENHLSRTLTDLGFGKKFKAEFFHDGKVITKDFVVTQSPTHYDSAPRYKSAALGITVRDLTYEVRLYFQKKDTDPGVIVSKVEPGSKGSVAGLKRYEVITHINDVEVKNVKDFEKQLGDAGDELRLTVKRMTQGRVVKIKMSGAAGEEASPAPEKPAAEKSAAEKPAAEKPAAEKPAAEKSAAEKPATPVNKYSRLEGQLRRGQIRQQRPDATERVPPEPPDRSDGIQEPGTCHEKTPLDSGGSRCSWTGRGGPGPDREAKRRGPRARRCPGPDPETRLAGPRRAATGDADPRVLRANAWPAIDALLGFFGKPEQDLAAQTLVAIGQPAVDPLLGELKDPNVDMRIWAAGLLGRLGDLKARNPLLAMLADPNVRVSHAAAEALAAMPEPGLAGKLSTMLKDPAVLTRWSALAALALSKRPEDLAAMEAAAKDESVPVRMMAGAGPRQRPRRPRRAPAGRAREGRRRRRPAVRGRGPRPGEGCQGRGTAGRGPGRQGEGYPDAGDPVAGPDGPGGNRRAAAAAPCKRRCGRPGRGRRGPRRERQPEGRRAAHGGPQ